MSQSIVRFSQAMRGDAGLCEIMALNDKTEKHGLSLTEQEVKDLIEQRFEILNTMRRVEFGSGILPDLITVFASSPYLMSDTYLQTISDLQGAFYRLKEEGDEKISDDDLLDAMRTLFDEEAHGSVDYFDDLPPSVVFDRVARGGKDAHENWSEFDSYDDKDADDTTTPAEHTEVDRIDQGSSHERPDNEYAENFYDPFDELYRSGFDFNSRIGGSIF